MKQKLFFLMLTLFMLSAASVQAQVTIGADAPPHSSAVLDLQSDNLGFKLPTIELGDVAVFQLSGTAEEADGIMIYNSSDATIGGSGKGIYVWNGSKWNFAGKSGQIVPADIPVKKIEITSAGYATEIKASGAGNTLQLTATVEPTEASQEVIWSKVYSAATTAGDVTIDATGLVTGVKTGTVTVRATATDGSGVYRNLELTVKPTSYVADITVTPVNGSSTVEVDKTLQLQATVAPLAAYPAVTWSIDNPTVASINTSTGLVSALSTGDATVTATAMDVGGVTADYPITVVPSTVPPLVTDVATIGEVVYKTYDYNGTVWTVENMKHGTANATMYDNDPEKPAWYYTSGQALDPGLCTDGFALPTQEQVQDLLAFLNGPFAEPEEILPWKGAKELVGNKESSTAPWREWGLTVAWWYDAGDGAYGYWATVGGVIAIRQPAVRTCWYSVRCVQE
jgi:uncharacterized protein (TIGR02145 family)